MGLIWDIFCRVIDNFGDIGVSSRLARDLADRGETVRLWLDDTSALQWMAGAGMPPGISVRYWDESLSEAQAGDVVIETFGCELPQPFLGRMAQRSMPPLWLNLEYLSAEPYVERSHGLASPQFTGAGRGLRKQFFYPGFSARTGGLLREPGLLVEQAGFDACAWLAARQLERQAGELIVSLFAYANPALPDLLAELAKEPTLLLVCPGAAQAQMLDLQRRQELPTGHLRWHALPYLSQADYDRLLWTCDLNFVRGEDSFVRAQWAGKPFAWQIYFQTDGAHTPKLEAFMDLYLAGSEASLAEQTRALWRGWNGLQAWSGVMPDLEAARGRAIKWREHLTTQQDLVSQLLTLAHKSS
ncbi:elongation factor P maturation arginine rhamnosyltransferase EarP [Roseateles oligotrophus]|uniref:Protein-arginine rhamnosyltransferase n=1 Tax=Roseateles oligotrophus TaxID=1769250 RepID=A0ABT2YA43_9BURK|nr:elongation factor P maturation arginine rhamnosyltransferase EarP [Roseateles oligotrophus]MCV2367163.1 elongation factor P maturation arginine rhamnosyltransferase EarP [Roseateles oligotrophus]